MADNDFLNITQELLGAGTSLVGGLQSTNSLFAGASRARQAGSFNAQIDKFNSIKRINSLAREVQRVLGTQGVQASASGFRGTSKSFLQVKAASLAELERQIREEKSASRLRQDVARFEADSRAAALRASARSQRTSTFTQLGSNLSDLAGLFDEE